LTVASDPILGYLCDKRERESARLREEERARERERERESTFRAAIDPTLRGIHIDESRDTYEDAP